MKCLFKTIKVFIIVLLSIILLINIYILTSKYIFKKYPPKLFGYFYATVASGSMEPAFSKGDLLLFKKIGGYEVNDIVMFKEHNTLITHRIVEINDKQIVTKGDANNTIDSYELEIDDIEGKVIKIIPNIGLFFNYFKSSFGIFSVIVVLVIIVEIERIKFEMKIRRLKNEVTS